MLWQLSTVVLNIAIFQGIVLNLCMKVINIINKHN